MAVSAKVLEAAGLVTAVRVGRQKLHYLNPVPLQEIAGRWLDTFSATTAQALLNLREQLEPPTERKIMHESAELVPNIVYRIDIRADQHRVWDALTETGVPRPWMWGSTFESSYDVGDGYSMSSDGVDLIVGTVLESDPPRYMRMTFDPRWDDESAAERAGELIYVLETRENGSTRLTITLAGLGPASASSAVEDTPEIYSGLKSYVETGTAL